MPRPGDIVDNTLVQPPTCPNRHPLPRPHWHLCDLGGHMSWLCEVCRAEIHAEHGCA